MKNDELREACLAYFRSMPVFERLLSQFCEKYRSYGCFCGSARLNIRSEDEREALEGFFARSYHNQKTATISAQAFRRALEHTRFVELSPEEILEAFAGAPLSGKREEESRRKACIARCWKAAIGQQEAYADCEASRQLLHELRAVAEKEEPAISSEDVPSIGAIDNTAHTCTSEEAVTALYRQLMSGRQELVENKLLCALTEDLHILVRALEILNRLCVEKRYQYLPVFAAVLFGDPHRLDPGTRDAHLLQLLLQWLEIQRGVEADEMNSIPSLRRQARYLSAGILLDDVSNYAMLCGVEAIGRDGLVHAGMAGFAADGAPVNVPLSVITGWAQLRCRDNTLWIVENPVVYAVLCERFGRTRSLMCMNGQPRLSAWLILRLLRAAGTRVYYAGDFDPEGLCIAEKVQQSLLPGQCVFWHMSEADYRSAQSRKPIEARRMKMLDHLQDSLLKTTAVLIRKQGVAGYQENILQMYLSEENT
ncbi:TIGR02679 domain-containing protein [Oribacterium sp. HCP3S3_B9]|uniref:TIGR02679 domain-containing protein n=1 Tax=unclassified Oribacterium TaxID=2629782 RepID=UPI002A7BBC03|nr:TIGR02679 domain-containing protein [Oliverpabstia sp.]